MAQMTKREVLLALADGQTLQIYNHHNGWVDLAETSIFAELNAGWDKFSYRIKPKTKFINGIEVAMHVVDAPAKDQQYYCVNPHHPNFASTLTWDGTTDELNWLSRGLVYLHKQDAVKAGQAMTTYEIK